MGRKSGFLYIDFPNFSVVIDFSKMKIQYFSDSSLTHEIGRDELEDPEDDIIQDILEKETVLTIEDYELEDQLEAEEEVENSIKNIQEMDEYDIH